MFHKLPLIYNPDRSSQVCQATMEFLEARNSIHETLEESLWAYQSIGRSIPHTVETMFSGHFFPFRESHEELQISYNLAFFGFYKQAFASLRSSLELGLLSVYYNINDEGHTAVKAWLNSRDTWDANTPKASKIWSILLSNPNIHTFQSTHDIKAYFGELSFLHNYVHTKGFKFSNSLGKPKSNYQVFDEDVFFKWINTVGQVVSIVATLHLLKYPIGLVEFDWGLKFGIDVPAFGGMDGSEICRIKKFLAADWVTTLEEIASKDERTQATLKEIISLPDITAQDIESQILEMDKSMIKMAQSFSEWENQELQNLQYFSDSNVRSKILSRVAVLRVWAKENGISM